MANIKKALLLKNIDSQGRQAAVLDNTERSESLIDPNARK